MPDNDPANLIFGPMRVQNDIERNQHPRQPGCAEGEQTQETQPHIGIPATPDVHEGGAEGGAEEGLVGEGRDDEQGDGGVGEEPDEVRDGGGGFLEHAGVALDEEDVEEEVEGEGAEVDEGGDEAPVLFRAGMLVAVEREGVVVLWLTCCR